MVVRIWSSRPGRRRMPAATAKTMSTCRPVSFLLRLPLTLSVFAGICDSHFVSHAHGLEVNNDGDGRKAMEVVGGWWEGAHLRRVVPAGPDRVPGRGPEPGADVETWAYGGSRGGVGGDAKESSWSTLGLATTGRGLATTGSSSSWGAKRWRAEDGGPGVPTFLNFGPGPDVDPSGDGGHRYGRPTGPAAVSVTLGVDDTVVIATVLEVPVPGLDSGPGLYRVPGSDGDISSGESGAHRRVGAGDGDGVVVAFVLDDNVSDLDSVPGLDSVPDLDYVPDLDSIPGLDSVPGSFGHVSSGRRGGHRPVGAGDGDGVVATVVLDDTVPGLVSVPGLDSVPGVDPVPGSGGDVSSGRSGGRRHVAAAAAAAAAARFPSGTGFGGKRVSWPTAARRQGKGGGGAGGGGDGGSPGIELTLTQKGLTYTKEVLVEEVLKDMIPLRVPDLRTSSAAEFGEADATLHNIVVSSLDVPESAVDLSAGSVTIFGAGILAHVSLEWKYSLSNPYIPIPIGDEGTADITLHGMQSGVTFTMTEFNGTLVISVIECGSFIEDLQIEMHGGVSWLYNWFIRSFSEKIKSAVQDAITKGVIASVGKLDAYVQGLPRRLPIDDVAAIDVTIVSDPTMQPEYLSVGTKGEFVSVSGGGSGGGTRDAPPPPPAQVPRLATACGEVEKMVTVALSEFVLNSASAVYHASGSFHWSVDELPDKSPIRLNTSSWRFMLPQLYLKYPNRAIHLDVMVTSPPVVLLREEGIKAEVQTDLTIQVANATQTELGEEEEEEEEEEGVVKGEQVLVKERGGREVDVDETSRIRGEGGEGRGRREKGEGGRKVKEGEREKGEGGRKEEERGRREKGKEEKGEGGGEGRGRREKGEGEEGDGRERRTAMEAEEERRDVERRRRRRRRAGTEEFGLRIERGKRSAVRGEGDGRGRRLSREMAMAMVTDGRRRGIADDDAVSVACLGMTVAIEGVAEIDGNNITGRASLDDLKLTQKWSNIGRIPVSVIQSVVRTVVKGIIVPAINFHLKKGFPLPILPGVTLRDAVVKYANRSLVVCTDAEYEARSGSLASNPLETVTLATVLSSSSRLLVSS